MEKNCRNTTPHLSSRCNCSPSKCWVTQDMAKLVPTCADHELGPPNKSLAPFPLVSVDGALARIRPHTPCPMDAGAAPAATPLARQGLYLMMLENPERWSACLLALRDAAGELFSRLNFPTPSLPFLLHAPVVFLLVSRADLAQSPGPAMDDLLHGYLHTLQIHGIDVRRSRRRVVVVLDQG